MERDKLNVISLNGPYFKRLQLVLMLRVRINESSLYFAESIYIETISRSPRSAINLLLCSLFTVHNKLFVKIHAKKISVYIKKAIALLLLSMYNSISIEWSIMYYVYIYTKRCSNWRAYRRHFMYTYYIYAQYSLNGAIQFQCVYSIYVGGFTYNQTSVHSKNLKQYFVVHPFHSHLTSFCTRS